MKLMMITGGMLGFAIALALSAGSGADWSKTLWHACLSAYVAGLLFRWWGKVWVKNLNKARMEQMMVARDKAMKQNSNIEE